MELLINKWEPCLSGLTPPCPSLVHDGVGKGLSDFTTVLHDLILEVGWVLTFSFAASLPPASVLQLQGSCKHFGYNSLSSCGFWVWVPGSERKGFPPGFLVSQHRIIGDLQEWLGRGFGATSLRHTSPVCWTEYNSANKYLLSTFTKLMALWSASETDIKNIWFWYLKNQSIIFWYLFLFGK